MLLLPFLWTLIVYLVAAGITAVIIYSTVVILTGYSYQFIMWAHNFSKDRLELSDCSKRAFKKYFPDLKFKDLDIFLGANGVPFDHKGVTFHNTIYLEQEEFDTNNRDDINLLTHELYHIKQYRENPLRRFGFYSVYGWDMLTSKFVYTDMSLEKEAIEFEDSYGDRIHKQIIDKDCDAPYHDYDFEDDWYWVMD